MNAPLPEQAITDCVTLRQPMRRDGALLHDLVAACPPLDLNSRYAYLLLCEHHAGTSVIAECNGEVVGAITAYIPPAHPETLFVWQVAVSEKMRGQRLGSRMLDHLKQRCIDTRGLRWLETTISPSNQASQQLFTRFAARHGAGCTTATLFAADDFGASGHEEECLYRIGPFGRTA